MKKKVHFGDNTVFNDLYSGSASLGRDYAKIVSIFSFVAAAILVIFGIYFIRKPNTYSLKVNFTVTKVTPITQTVYDANVGKDVPKIVYNLEGTVTECGTNVVKLEYSSKVNVGNILQVYIEPRCNANIAVQNADNNTMLGWVLIIIAIVIVVFTLIRLFFVNKYKGVAAIQGAAGAKNIFQSLF